MSLAIPSWGMTVPSKRTNPMSFYTWVGQLALLSIRQLCVHKLARLTHIALYWHLVAKETLLLLGTPCARRAGLSFGFSFAYSLLDCGSGNLGARGALTTLGPFLLRGSRPRDLASIPERTSQHFLSFGPVIVRPSRFFWISRSSAFTKNP